MADSPVRMLVKIGDPTTAANEAAVSASGELSVILAANDGVDIGDVGIADFAATLTDDDDDIVAGAQTTLRTLDLNYGWDGAQWERLTTDGSGSLDVNVTLALPTGANTIGGVTTVADEVDDTAVSVAGGLHMAGLVFDDTTPVVIEEGDAGYQRMSADREAYTITRDAAGNERGANVTAANELNVIATAQAGVDIGDVTINGAPTGASAIEVQGTVAEAAAVANNPFLIAGDDGTNVRHVTVDASGNLQVDVLSGGGESTPTGHVAVRATASDVAVDATLTVDEAEAGGTTSKLRGFDASASVPIKAEVQEVTDGTGVPKVTLFAQAGEPIEWRAPHRDYFETAFSANAGFDGWRVVITNKDSTDAADLYGTIYTEN